LGWEEGDQKTCLPALCGRYRITFTSDRDPAVCRSFAAKGLLPSWYMALRLPLTLAAVSGMMITLVGSFMMAPAYPPQ